MSSKLQRAKQLFENSQYEESKQLLLEVTSSGENTHYSLYEKLGDISIELNEYNESLKYYTQCMNKNPDNPNIYIKLGDLYHSHLSDDTSAIKMYEQCIEIHPNNERCWFNYGKLSFTLGDYCKSEECYLACKTPRACVKYHYAKLLLSSKWDKNDGQRALKLCSRACKLKPNIFRYHLLYALTLRDMNQSKNANHQFNIALKCITCEEIESCDLINFYYEYAIFLSEYYSKYNTALLYLEKAMNLIENENNKYKHVLDEYNNLSEHIESICRPSARAQIDMNQEIIIDNNLLNPNIKLIIYSFEQCITYNKFEFVDNDFNKIRILKKIIIVNNIFGGDDRIDRLHFHFQRLVTSARNNIRLGIVSQQYDVDVMIELLGRVGLIKYFDKFDVFGGNNIVNTIELIANKYKCNLLSQVLYIDNRKMNMNMNCITYHVYDENKILNGLNMKCLREIELIVGVYILDEYEIINFEPQKELKLSINEINKDVYWKIKRQIGQVSKFNKYSNNNASNSNLNNLQIIQWIRKNWKNKEYKQHFLYFAKLFQIIRSLNGKGRDWTSANILSSIIKIVPTDGEIQRRYAKCLAFLGHIESAEYYFQNAINNSRHFLHRMEYAYFLLKLSKFEKAEIYFKQCIQIMDKKKTEQNKTKLYIGYAKCLQGLNKNIYQIENIYKLAMQNADHKYDDIGNIYSQFANYLFKKKKYKKSKIQFQNALKWRNDSIQNHYGLAKVLNKMRLYSEYKLHLNKVLQMDKNHVAANHDLNQLNTFLNQQNQQNYDEKNDDLFKEQFNTFWFDIIGTQNQLFNKYFDAFEANNLNHINVILFDTAIENKLKYKIGVENHKNIKIIMDKVNCIRSEHEIFKIKLNQCKLYKNNCYNIFAKSAIYTIHAVINSVKCKADIIKLITCYNKDTKDREKQVDETDEQLIKRIWNFVQTLKQN